MAGIHSGKLGVKITPVEQNDPFMGCERPSQMPVGGDLSNMIDVPIMRVEDNGVGIFIYRHPYFFIPQSVWYWYEEYSYYQRVQDHTPYYDRDPRYTDAVNIYESELNRWRAQNA